LISTPDLAMTTEKRIVNLIADAAITPGKTHGELMDTGTVFFKYRTKLPQSLIVHWKTYDIAKGSVPQ
jgi:hypothetical protein